MSITGKQISPSRCADLLLDKRVERKEKREERREKRDITSVGLFTIYYLQPTISCKINKMKILAIQNKRKFVFTVIAIISISIIVLTIIFLKIKNNQNKTYSNSFTSTTTISTSTASTTTATTTIDITAETASTTEETNTGQENTPQSNYVEPEPLANWWDYPSQTYPAIRSGDDLLVLVNKTYFLPPEYQPSDLVTLDIANTGGIRVYDGWSARSIILGDLANLGQAASATGINLGIVSAYISYYTQESTYNYWVSQVGQTQADMVSARAGHSQHQLGTALDFTTDIGYGDMLWQDFDGTPAANWLSQNAWQYGFVQSYPAGWESTTGYSAESWHYRYIGVENAAEWYASGQVLEVWLRTQ